MRLLDAPSRYIRRGDLRGMAPEGEPELASGSSHVWKTADIPVRQLLFDPENPRMASVAVRNPSQKNLLKILWEEMAVDEIALSIASNGYFREGRDQVAFLKQLLAILRVRQGSAVARDISTRKASVIILPREGG